MEQVECIVVGAGVVGLACAVAIARSGREVLVLECEDGIGTQTSSRNSEVIHAGIYYQPNSLKAKLCREGKEKLYEYAIGRGIKFSRTGKLIVASSELQILSLQALRSNAIANRITDLEFLTRSEVGNLESAVSCSAAILSPSTGIIDSHAFMLALEHDLEALGGMLVLRTPVSSCTVVEHGIVVETGGVEPTRILARYLVNCAGLKAPTVARAITGLKRETIPQENYAIGHYYRLSGASPCQRLIYPLPEPGGLGIHLTVDLGGQAKFGPDVRWINKIDYSFDDSQLDWFLSAIRKYLPEIERHRLLPDYTGIRPKIVGVDAPAADFRIDGENVHGGKGVVNLFGIESPGLTASLAIGDYVAKMVV